MKKLSTRSFWGLLILIAGGQTAIIGKLIVDRHRLIATGREMTIEVTPVDPRDLMRGDYVVLGYPISTISHDTAKEGPLPAGIAKGEAVFVTLAPGAPGVWTVANVAASYPTSVPDGSVVIKGRVTEIYGTVESGTYSMRVQYGIENYFVPEGMGKPLEDMVREHKTAAVLAIGSDGQPAIKALIADGQRQDVELLF